MTFETITELIKTKNIELKSTQNKLCYPILIRIYKKMKAGIAFTGIKVDDNIIIDGHHRYIASLIADIPLDRYPSKKTSATVITDWENVILVKEDWDTDAKILVLNEQDANFNNISIEKLTEILK